MSDETSVKIGGKDYVLRPFTIDQLEKYVEIADGSRGSIFRIVKFVLEQCADAKDVGKLFIRGDEITAVLEAVNKLNGLVAASPPVAVPPAAS